MDAVLYIHGRGGRAAEAEHYKPLFPACKVIGLDYKGSVPWEAGKEIHKAIAGLKGDYDRIILIANSIGAFFSMNADIEKDIKTLKTGKIRELSTALLSTDALSAKTLDASLSIGDYGMFNGNEFVYDTILAGKMLAEDASVNTLTVKTILGENEEISFGKESKLTSAGLYSNNV